MPLPLYKELHQNTALRFDTKGHSGLWFERFYNAYLPEIKPREEYSKAEKDRLIEQKKQWLKAFQQHNSQIGNVQALQHHARKQVRLIQALKGAFLVCQTQWHFVTGMGLPHPIENGITWHPTLGVPYLTGAAIKGIVRTWLSAWDTIKDEENKADNAQQRERLWRWFGSEYKTPDDLKEAKKKEDFIERDNQTGYLSFFDAFPVKSPQLGVDIITPHAGKWYAEGGDINNPTTESDKIPADWHDPIPVKFLVIKEAQFLFSVAPRNKKCAEQVDMKQVQQALKEALTWLGTGAKTAVGYGVFEVDEVAKKYLENGVKNYEKKAKTLILVEIDPDTRCSSF
jgi:CRISPR-associated protein Cmr6